MFVKHFLINYLYILGISNCTQPFYLVWLNSTLNPKPNIDHITYPGFIYVRKQKRFDCFLLLIMRKMSERQINRFQSLRRQRGKGNNLVRSLLPGSYALVKNAMQFFSCFSFISMFFFLFPKNIAKSLIFSK